MQQNGNSHFNALIFYLHETGKADFKRKQYRKVSFPIYLPNLNELHLKFYLALSVLTNISLLQLQL